MKKDEGLKHRLKSLRNVLSITQKKLSEVLSCSQAKISDYESGKLSISNKDLITIANTFKVDLNWLVTGEGDMFVTKDRARASDSLVDISVVAPIAAGTPLEVIEAEPLEVIQVPSSLLSLPPPYYAFQVQGESMSPFIIAGDIVILSRDWRGIKLNGRICGFRTPDGITIKKLVLQSRQKTAWLMPLNHNFTPTPYNKDSEELTLFGVLILSIRRY